MAEDGGENCSVVHASASEDDDTADAVGFVVIVRKGEQPKLLDWATDGDREEQPLGHPLVMSDFGMMKSWTYIPIHAKYNTLCRDIVVLKRHYPVYADIIVRMIGNKETWNHAPPENVWEPFLVNVVAHDVIRSTARKEAPDKREQNWKGPKQAIQNQVIRYARGRVEAWYNQEVLGSRQQIVEERCSYQAFYRCVEDVIHLAEQAVVKKWKDLRATYGPGSFRAAKRLRRAEEDVGEEEAKEEAKEGAVAIEEANEEAKEAANEE